MGRASCRNKNAGISAKVSEGVALPSTPGITGGVACTGADTGDTCEGAALAGAPGKCGSEGRDISEGAAGAVTGGEDNALVLNGASAGSARKRGLLPPGSAVKNSFAMRASVAGSGSPAGASSVACRIPADSAPGLGPVTTGS